MTVRRLQGNSAAAVMLALAPAFGAALIAQPAAPPAMPLRLECSFAEAGAEDEGARRIAFEVAARGARVTEVSVDDPTGIFTSGNIVGFVSAGRDGGRYVQAPRDEPARWRGRLENGRLSLVGTRRQVELSSDTAGIWSGRLRYELGGAGSIQFATEGRLACQQAAAGPEGSPQ